MALYYFLLSSFMIFTISLEVSLLRFFYPSSSSSFSFMIFMIFTFSLLPFLAFFYMLCSFIRRRHLPSYFIYPTSSSIASSPHPFFLVTSSVFIHLIIILIQKSSYIFIRRSRTPVVSHERSGCSRSNYIDSKNSNCTCSAIVGDSYHGFLRLLFYLVSWCSLH